MQPNFEICEAGITELIDKDDTAVSAGDYSSTADITMPTDLSGGGGVSGYITSVLLVSLEVGSGDVQTPGGTLFFFDTDPNTTSGDTATAAAGVEHKTLIGYVDVVSSDWNYDAAGAAIYTTCAIPFHAVKTIHVVFRPIAGSTEINSAAGDDEELFVNFWFERWS